VDAVQFLGENAEKSDAEDDRRHQHWCVENKSFGHGSGIKLNLHQKNLSEILACHSEKSTRPKVKIFSD
jgi:hypothetical protein